MKRKFWLFWGLLALVISSISLWWIFINWQKRQKLKAFLEQKTNEIFSTMTVEERVGQLIHIALPGKTMNPQAEKLLRTFKPGGVILFGANLGSASEIKAFTTALQQVSNLPLFISTDQEGGAVLRVQDPVPPFPSAAALGQMGRSDLCEAVGFMTSWYLSSVGINVLLAPVLDINNNPENPVIHWRSFGSKPETVITCAIPFERGARSAGALPVIKHFPGHGDTTVDSHLGLPIIQKSWQQLQEFELLPFVAAIRSGAQALMTAHILYPAIDEKLPATLSEKIITHLLRHQLGFDGLIFTDAMEMQAIAKNYEKEHSPASLAIQAGVDVILLTSYTSYPAKFYRALKQDYLQGKFYRPTGDLLERAVKRQILLKLKQGLFSKEVVSDFAELEEFLASRKRQQEKQYHSLQKKYPNLANLTSQLAIRSLKANFQKRPLPEITQTEFLISNPTLRTHFLALYGAKELPFRKLTLSLKRSTRYVIADSYGQYELDTLDNSARQNPHLHFLILHYGKPYLKMPISANIDLLFSFSPTLPSLAELAKAAFGTGEVPVAELALQWRKQKK